MEKSVYLENKHSSSKYKQHSWNVAINTSCTTVGQAEASINGIYKAVIPAPHIFPLKVRRQYRLYVKGNSKLIGSQETATTLKIMSLVS